MRRLTHLVYLVAVTAWVGGMWAIGYLAAPVLFASLGDRQLAGVVAGKMFSLMGWVGLVAAAYSLTYLLARFRAAALRQGVFWLTVVMALLVAAGQFGIQPLMVQMKADAWPRDVMESVMRDRFVAWHGVSSVLYLLQSLLGAALLWLGRRLAP